MTENQAITSLPSDNAVADWLLGYGSHDTGSDAGKRAVILFALMVALCAAPFSIHLYMDSYTGDRYVAAFATRWAAAGVIWGLFAYWLGTQIRRTTLFGEHIIVMNVDTRDGTGKFVYTEIFVNEYLANKAMVRLRKEYSDDHYTIGQGLIIDRHGRRLTFRGLGPSDFEDMAEKTHYDVNSLMKIASDERRNTEHPGAIILFFLRKYSSLLASLVSFSCFILLLFVEDWGRYPLRFLFPVAYPVAVLIALVIGVFYLHRQLQDWPCTFFRMYLSMFVIALIYAPLTRIT